MAGLSSLKDDTSSIASDASVYSGSNHPKIQLLRGERASCNFFKREYVATALELEQTTTNEEFEDILPELDAHRSCLHKAVHEYVAMAKTVAAIPELADLSILKRTNSALASIRKLWRLSRYVQPAEYTRNPHLPSRDEVFSDAVLPSMIEHIFEPAPFNLEMAEDAIDFEETRRDLLEFLSAMQTSKKTKRPSSLDVSASGEADLRLHESSVTAEYSNIAMDGAGKKPCNRIAEEEKTQIVPGPAAPPNETNRHLQEQTQDAQRHDIDASAAEMQEKGFVEEESLDNHEDSNATALASFDADKTGQHRSRYFNRTPYHELEEESLQQFPPNSQRYASPGTTAVERIPEDEHERQRCCISSDRSILTRHSVAADQGNKVGVHFQQQTYPRRNRPRGSGETSLANQTPILLTQRRQRGGAGSRLGLAHSTLSQVADGYCIPANEPLEYDAIIRARELGMKEMEASRPKTPVGILDSADYIILRHKFVEATSNQCLSPRDKLRELQRWFARPASDLVDAAIMGMTTANAQQQLDKCLENLDKLFNTRSDTLRTTFDAITSKGTLRHNDYIGHKSLCCSLIRAKAVANVCGMLNECDDSATIRSIIDARVPHLADEFWSRIARNGNRPPTFDYLIKEIDFWATWNLTKGPDASVSFEGNCQSSPGEKPENCNICNGFHHSHHCSVLEAMHDVGQRVKKLAKKSLCFHCFKPGHSARLCTEKPICSKPQCTRRHATLLHDRSFPSRTS